MDWNAIGAVGELIGALAVVASLAYLAVQIRRSSRDSERTIFFSIRNQVQEFRAILAQDADLSRIYRDGLADIESLSDDDRWRFGALMQYEFAFFEDVFLLGRDTKLIHTNAEDLRWLVRRPGARGWWEKGKRLYSPGFRRQVDAMIAEH
jgi:hypothetical protein